MHHLAFDFAGAEAAYDEAFACKVEPVLQPERSSGWRRRSGRRALAPGLAYIADTSALTAHVFRGLLMVDRELNVMPSLAENFRVSADGAHATCSRSATTPAGATASRSPRTTSSYTWERVAADSRPPPRFLLEDMERAEAIDDHTLEVTLREPRNYFLYVLAAPASYPWPKHLCERFGEDWHKQTPLVSNGPFVVDGFGDDRLTLAANPEFDGPRGNLREVEVRYRVPGSDPTTLWNEGMFDALSAAHAATGTPVEGTELDVAPALGTTMLGFHPQGPFADLRVRVAVAAAVTEVGSKLEQLGIAARPARGGGLLPPAMPGHVHHARPEPTVAEARALLAEAGYRGAASGCPPCWRRCPPTCACSSPT